jgi:prephenate dehydrogenase
MTKSVGIIGFGRFGQFAAEHLRKHFKIFAYDHVDRRKEAAEIGVEFTSLKECASKDIVLLCTPISVFEDVLTEVIPFLKKGALVVDVCSVKEKPVAAMKKLIPARYECIGMHPLFGPDTCRNGIEGKKIVLCPVRTKNLAHVKEFLTKLGLSVVTATPEEHDREMAKSLALIHLLGRALDKIGVDKVEMATPTHEMFIELVDIVRKDSKELFMDMQRYNRFASDVRKTLLHELMKMDGEIDGMQ